MHIIKAGYLTLTNSKLDITGHHCRSYIIRNRGPTLFALFTDVCLSAFNSSFHPKAKNLRLPTYSGKIYKSTFYKKTQLS